MCFIVLTPVSAYADELQNQANDVLAQINSLNEQINDLNKQYNDAIAEQKELQEKIQLIQNDIDKKTAELDLLQNRLGSRITEMYRGGQISIIDVFLCSDSWNDLVYNWDLMNKLNNSDDALIQETKKMREDIEADKEKYEQLEQDAAERIAEAALSKEKAEELLADAQATYDNLNAEVAQVVVAAEEKQAEINRNAEIIATGNSIVDRAYGELGKPYVWGAVGPHSYDCSGLVSYCISGQNTRLGTTSTFMGWTRISDPIPGDICVNNGHCGIYIGNGQMIHAPQSGDVVKVGPVQSGMIYVRP